MSWRFEAGFAALEVGVFDAQDHERAALLAREQPVEERGAGIADVQMPGRGRRKAHANWAFFAHALMVTKAVASCRFSSCQLENQTQKLCIPAIPAAALAISQSTLLLDLYLAKLTANHV